MVTCSKCGTKNHAHAEFCTDCGFSLYSLKKRDVRENGCFGADKRGRDYMGFLSFGSFLIIIGIVITVNANVFSNVGVWLKQLTNERVWIRPPEELITSFTLFLGLSGISNFFMAALRFVGNRSRRHVLIEVLSGFALIFFAYLINQYNNHALRLRMVGAIEIIVCGLLIILYTILRHIFYNRMDT